MIIGILGQAGCGKDTMADHLKKKYEFQKVALADPLKRICKEVYKFTDEQLWGPSEERNKPDMRYPNGRGGFLTPREALQLLGTEWGRHCYEDTWVDYGLDVAKRILKGEHYDQRFGFVERRGISRIFKKTPAGVVIPDERFKNEIRKTHLHGGVVIRLKRDGKDGDIGAGVKNHASEMEQKSIMDDEIDFILDVPEGIPAFHKAIDDLFIKIEATGRMKKAA